MYACVSFQIVVMVIILLSLSLISAAASLAWICKYNCVNTRTHTGNLFYITVMLLQ